MRRRRGALPAVRAQQRRSGPLLTTGHSASSRARPADFVGAGARTSALLYSLFFCSGVSGLVYEVAWVRQFGYVFGNTVYSAAVVVAVFMLGLGAGGYFVGVWADRRYARQPESLLRAYGWAELAIGLAGAALGMILPRLVPLDAAASSYSLDSHGWHVLSISSYVIKSALAIVLLTPVTFLMGGTLTLL